MRKTTRKLPEIHIDIGSHNLNPKARKPRAKQVVKKAAPVKREVRRANPMGKVDPYLSATGIIRQTILRARKETSKFSKQAAISYAQGIIDFSRKINLISADEHAGYIAELKIAME